MSICIFVTRSIPPTNNGRSVFMIMRLITQRTLTQQTVVISVAGQIARVKQEVLVSRRFGPEEGNQAADTKRPTEVERSPAARSATEQTDRDDMCLLS